MGVGKTKDSWEYMNGAKLFDKWAELGSLSKVRQWMINQGITNPATGDPPTNAGIRVAVRRWQAEHPEESRRKMAALGEEWVNDDTEYWPWLIQQARGAIGDNDFQRFIERNHLEKFSGVAAGR
jgi:hypothetical protein